MLITGDFNYPELDCKNRISPADLQHKASMFMATRDAFLTQHVTYPTHYSLNYRGVQTPHTLDLIFTNDENMISNLDPPPPDTTVQVHLLLRVTW